MGQTSEEYQDKDTMTQRGPAITLLAAEALCGSANGSRAAEPPAKGDERMSMFWRVFGGTLLSIAALVVVTLYQQFSGSINELRADILRLNESRGDLVKQDELNTRMAPVWNGLSDAKSGGAALAALREKQAQQEQQLKQLDDERKDLLRDVQQLRERVAKLEGRDSGGKSTATMSREIPD
jgi:DNA repair exonuclease SbcCD ATPase subunit